MNDEPASEILDAAHRTLCEHGYADLSLRSVAATPRRSEYTGAIPDQLVDLDALRVERVRSVIATGAGRDEFDGDLDPALAAEFLATTIGGANEGGVDRSTSSRYEMASGSVERQLVAGTGSEGLT